MKYLIAIFLTTLTLSMIGMLIFGVMLTDYDKMYILFSRIAFGHLGILFIGIMILVIALIFDESQTNLK